MTSDPLVPEQTAAAQEAAAAQSEILRVYVDGQPVDLERGATVLRALEGAAPQLARDVSAGAAVVTDSRGLPVAVDAIVVAGSIFRVTRARTRGR